MQLITIANQKGGCGKTITAINLASALAGGGKKVLFIDLDPQSHATSALGMSLADPLKTAYAMFEAFLTKDNIFNLFSLIQRKYDNLWVISSHILLSTMEQKLAGKQDAMLILARALTSNIKSEFDYAIVDTPPNLGFLTLNAILAADRLIVPIDISIFSLNGIDQINKILEISAGMGFRKPQINFLITMFDKRSNFAKNFLERVKLAYWKELLSSVIRSNIRLREAALLGKSIFEYDDDANGAIDYGALAKEIAPEIESAKIVTEPLCETARTVETMLKVRAPEAREVFIAGDFNEWHINNMFRMEKAPDGVWVKKITLPEGKYYYKFVIDGKWREDPENKLTEDDSLGGKNSVLLLKPFKIA